MSDNLKNESSALEVVAERATFPVSFLANFYG
jgi:hypothetical protein